MADGTISSSFLVMAATLKYFQNAFFSPAQVLMTGATLWITWWMWKFWLSPKMHPDSPRQVPYWIPVIGHVRGMFLDPNKLFTYGREYFGNTREIFSITVMGQEIYIVTAAQDVSSIYKTTKAFDFNPVVRDVFADFGVTSYTTGRLYDPCWPHGKHWIDLMHENFRVQMHPGEKMLELQSTFLANVEGCLTWERLSGSMVLDNSRADIKVVSLFRWSFEALVSSASKAFFGETIFEVAPSLLEDFLTFDTEGWKMPFKYPYFAAKDMHNAKRKCEEAFEKYLALPENERKNAVWLVRNIEDSMKDLGIAQSQTARIHFVLYRLINTNAYRTCFWCLSYILQDRSLLDAISSETAAAFSLDGKLSMEYLLDKCPLLNSFYEEVVRKTTYPIGARDVVSEVTIGGKVLAPGNKLLMPFHEMHSNPEVFGANTAEFDPRRFLKNQSLVKSTSYRPFGGGLTYCPGRFLARREIFMFVVLFLHRFDVELEPGKNGSPVVFPRMDESLALGGAMSPQKGNDLVVRVRAIKPAS